MKQGEIHICSEDPNRKAGIDEKRSDWTASFIYVTHDDIMARQLPKETRL